MRPAIRIILPLFSLLFLCSCSCDRGNERAGGGKTSDEDKDIASGNNIETPPIPINLCLTNAMSDISESKTMDGVVEKFLWKWKLKGASVAIVQHGRLVYAKGYGWADKEKGERMEPKHIFRLASLSKLITATAIMKLCQEGHLSLGDKVFGEGAILDCPQFQNIRDKRMKEITVEMLLRHMAGFTYRRGDPMFTVLDIMKWEHLDSAPDMDGMIEYALTQSLGCAPGSSYHYSNLGYLILTKIVEQVSGMGYEAFCQKEILHPAGCYDMHIAHNLYEEKYPNEVRYYEAENAGLVEAYDGSGEMRRKCYGGSNINGLLGAGAWVSSPAEYVKFVSAIDGDDATDDILDLETVREMTECPEGENYPIGWISTENGEWCRTGTLSGTSAMVKKKADGSIWMFITNTSCWNGPRFTKYINKMFSDAYSQVCWPTDRDLFQ